MNNHKIIIIGGGIGGLMTAIALNKKGISSAIFEKSPSFDANVAGLALWSNATGILDKFGLLKKLLTFGNVLKEMKTLTAEGNLMSVVRLNKLETRFHFPSIMILRSDLQKELLNAIPSSQIQFNKQCIKIESNTSIIRLHFADGTNETADAVVFADGIHSIARKDIFKLPSLKYAGRTSWRGVAKFENPVFSTDTNLEIFGNGRRIGIFPLPHNLAYWYAAVNMKQEEATKQKRTIDGVLSHFKDWAEPVNTLINSTRENRLILTNINYTNDIHSLVRGNIALLGDAAHPMTPDLGQGACQAIEDAYILAECLFQNATTAEGFKKYETIRLQRVKSIALNSFRIGRLRQMGNPVGVSIRNNIFRFLPERFALKMLERNITA
jgi:2-polyprenyl-6-methoxyphenol hydroxylase-like FAD-dependent oxidoreductase